MAKKSATVSLLSKNAIEESTGEDILFTLSNEIENVSEKDAAAMIPELLDDIELNSFKLGGVLAVIRDKGWTYGYESYDTLLSDKFNLGKRKAQYLVNIYTTLVNEQINWDDVKSIGWSKLRVIVPVLKKDNVAHWVKLAEENNYVTLEKMVKDAMQVKSGTEESEAISTPVSNMLFKVHEDQKATIRFALDKCKEETGTSFDTVALDTICQGYIGGNIDVKGGSSEYSEELLSKFMDIAGYQVILELFDKKWPEIELSVEIP